MKKRNFNMLENFEVPESWIENAINAKPAPQKKPFYLNPRYTRYIGIAASLVLAVGIALMSSLYINNNSAPSKSPAIAETNGYPLSTKPKGSIDITDGEKIVTTPTETKNSVHTTEPPEITNEPSEQQIGTAHTGTQESGNQASNNDRPERREQSNQAQQSNTRETPKPTAKPQNPTTPTEKPKDSEKEQPATSKEEQETTSPVNKKFEIDVKSGYNTIQNDDEKNTETYLNGIFYGKINVIVTKGKYYDCSVIKCKIWKDETEIGIIRYHWSGFKNKPDPTMIADLSKFGIPCGEYKFEFFYYNYDDNYKPTEEVYIGTDSGSLDKDVDLVFTIK